MFSYYLRRTTTISNVNIDGASLHAMLQTFMYTYTHAHMTQYAPGHCMRAYAGSCTLTLHFALSLCNNIVCRLQCTTLIDSLMLSIGFIIMIILILIHDHVM
jgi:hypothetical protein